MKVFALLMTLGLALAGCRGSVPQTDFQLYQGEPATGSIYRPRSQDRVACNTPAIQDYVCLKIDNFTANVRRLTDSCQQWNKGTKMMSQGQVRDLQRDMGR